MTKKKAPFPAKWQIRRVTCPQCGAPRNRRCVNEDGIPRKQSHKQRMELAVAYLRIETLRRDSLRGLSRQAAAVRAAEQRAERARKVFERTLASQVTVRYVCPSCGGPHPIKACPGLLN